MAQAAVSFAEAARVEHAALGAESLGPRVWVKKCTVVAWHTATVRPCSEVVKCPPPGVGHYTMLQRTNGAVLALAAWSGIEM